MYVRVPGKLSKTIPKSNPGDNVMISAGISCSQDLRLKHKKLY